MGGEQHARPLRIPQSEEQFQQLVPAHRVKPGGGLIQNEQPGVVAECQRQLVLHLHARRQLAHPLLFIQPEAAQQRPVYFLVPIREKTPGRVGDGLQFLVGKVVRAAADAADLRPPGQRIRRKGLAEQLNAARFGAQMAENGLQRGGLARAVDADEPHDRPGGHGEGDILQREGRIALTHAADLQRIHFFSSSTVSPRWAAKMALANWVYASLDTSAMPCCLSASSSSVSPG